MKQILSVIGIILPMRAFAHSGGLNKYGCHINHKINITHCHRNFIWFVENWGQTTLFCITLIATAIILIVLHRAKAKHNITVKNIKGRNIINIQNIFDKDKGDE